MGLISENSSYLDNIVILLLIIAVTVGIDYSCRYIFLGMFKRDDAYDPGHIDLYIVTIRLLSRRDTEDFNSTPKTLSDLYHSGFFKVYKRFLKSDPRDL